MSRTVGVLLGIVLGVGLGLVGTQMAGTASAVGSPTENGDVNGDGGIDIADAVYLLGFLFQEGPPPVPIIPTNPCSLPATNQTLCYDNAGPVECNDPDWPGQDGFYQLGCLAEGRFVDNGDGTISDVCTGLMWQKETAPLQMTWQNALIYSDTLGLADYTDWRLPNVTELHSIVNWGTLNPSSYPPFETEIDWYWSSTSNALDNQLNWSIRFSGGDLSFRIKTAEQLVRAVRGP